MVSTVTRSCCGARPPCDLPQEGGPAAVDKAAEKHTKATGHPTTVITEPAR